MSYASKLLNNQGYFHSDSAFLLARDPSLMAVPDGGPISWKGVMAHLQNTATAHTRADSLFTFQQGSVPKTDTP